MVFTDFITKFNGKYIDFDGAFGPQCMDLMHEYCVEVLGLANPKILAAAGARDVYNTFDTISGKEYFERIPNTPTGVPTEGDIVFWGNAPFGHVAIFVEGDANSFRSYDQNFPTGSPCHIQNHTYANVLGWLRFKVASMPTTDQLDEIKKQLADCELHKADLYKEKTQEYLPRINELETANKVHEENWVKIAQALNTSASLAEIMGAIASLTNADTQDALRAAQTKIVDLTADLNNARLEIAPLEKKVGDLTTSKADLQTMYDKLGREYDDCVTSRTFKQFLKIGTIYLCRKVVEK